MYHVLILRVAVDYEFMMKDRLSEIKAGLDYLDKIVNELFLRLKLSKIVQRNFQITNKLIDGPHPSEALSSNPS